MYKFTSSEPRRKKRGIFEGDSRGKRLAAPLRISHIVVIVVQTVHFKMLSGKVNYSL